ncbi:hypothetical protein ABK040_013985 [Willaertia magna]
MILTNNYLLLDEEVHRLNHLQSITTITKNSQPPLTNKMTINLDNYTNNSDNSSDNSSDNCNENYSYDCNDNYTSDNTLQNGLQNTLQKKHKFDYLIILDFEATCDNQENSQINIDNQEMIEFPYILLNLQNLKIEHYNRYYVKPIWNENLTNFCKNLTGITNEILKKEGKSLQQVLTLFDNFINKEIIEKNKTFCILTDSEWDIKNLLIKETILKGIRIPSYFRNFYNLRREYSSFYFLNHHYNNHYNNHYNHYNNRNNKRNNNNNGIKGGLKGMVEYLNLEFQGNHHCGLDDCFTICKIIERMVKDGFIFGNTEIIVNECYDPFNENLFTNFIQPSNSYNYGNNNSYSNTNYGYNNTNYGSTQEVTTNSYCNNYYRKNSNYNNNRYYYYSTTTTTSTVTTTTTNTTATNNVNTTSNNNNYRNNNNNSNSGYNKKYKSKRKYRSFNNYYYNNSSSSNYTNNTIINNNNNQQQHSHTRHSI